MNVRRADRYLFAAVAIALTLLLAGRGQTAENDAASEERLLKDVSVLASDELGGRGLGTPELEKAADYLAEQFRSLGLKTEVIDGKPFQPFSVNIASELGAVEHNQAKLVGPAGDDGKPAERVLKLNSDFTPLGMSGSGKVDLPLVFVGYGITAKDEGYDDYAGIDVQGKAVVVLRHEPQQDNPHSAFAGTRDSTYAPLRRKVSNAFEHGAAAIVFVSDEAALRKRLSERWARLQTSVDELAAKAKESVPADAPLGELEKRWRGLEQPVGEVRDQWTKWGEELDPLLEFGRTSEDAAARSFPVIHVRREALAGLGLDLAALEREIDQGPAPKSREIPDWRLQGEVSVNRREATVRNVVAVLEGEGPHADETVVVGAHYDHLGRGGSNSAAPGSQEIHNGADDNGSGTAALLEVARRLAGRKLPRRVVFIAFTGEEQGLLGSAEYVKHPVFPLEKTVAMLNMDMVGRLQDNKVIIEGVDTAKEFDPLLDTLNKGYGFELVRKPGGFGPSDHASFYPKQIPVMHFFTGTHEDYHRPSDDIGKLNVPGMRRIAGLVADAALQLAEAPQRTTYQESKRPAMGGGGGDRPYFGSIPDFGQNEPGYGISGVTKGSPADKGGLKGGDLIIKLGESRIENLEDFDSALRKFKAGDKVPVIVKRGGQEVKLEVTVDPPR
jgi:hypothetical protein